MTTILVVVCLYDIDPLNIYSLTTMYLVGISSAFGIFDSG